MNSQMVTFWRICLQYGAVKKVRLRLQSLMMDIGSGTPFLLFFELMVKLGLAIDPTEKKKRGRPRKEKVINDKPKRKPGRPKKNS